MPAVTLQPFPLYTAFDAVGNPLAGGLVDTYAAGTTTPLATYSDPGGTVPNTNPVVLDAAGRAPIYFQTGLAYKVRQLDSAGNVLWTVDNIVPTATSIDITAIHNEILTMKGTAVWTYDTIQKSRQVAPIWQDGISSWAHAATSTIYLQVIVPYDYASGPVTWHLLLRAATAVAPGVVVMFESMYRYRNASGVFTISAPFSAGFQVLDVLSHEGVTPVPSTAFIQGDTLQFILTRFGGDAADTYNGTIVLDGAWITYLGYASR